MRQNLSKNLLLSCAFTVWSGVTFSAISSSPADAAIFSIQTSHSNITLSQAEEPAKNNTNNVHLSAQTHTNSSKSTGNHNSFSVRGLLSFLGLKNSAHNASADIGVNRSPISGGMIQSFHAGLSQNPAPKNPTSQLSNTYLTSMTSLNNGPIDQKTGGFVAGWHSIGLIGAKNARDAGDYIIQDGHIMKSGKVYRSDNLQNATASDDKILASHNVKTIIDLRSPIEEALFPDQKIPGTRVIHQDIIGSLIPFEGVLTVAANVVHSMMQVPLVQSTVNSLENMLHPSADTTKSHSLVSDAIQAIEAPIKTMITGVKDSFMDAFYGQFVDSPSVRRELGATIKDIDQYTQDDQAVLIHCSAGKDRTGWVTALVQSELGIDPNTVRKDYLTSSSNGFPVENQYFDSALHEVKKNYGTIDNYVHQGLGVTDQDIKQLKVSLLD